MAEKSKTRTAPPAPQSELTPLEKARLARKEKGSRLPAKELAVTTRITEIRELEGELTPVLRNELKGLVAEKKRMSFARLASKHLKAACEAIDRIGNLASGSYISEPSQVANIEKKLSDRLVDCISRFSKTTREAEEDFSV